ncbi:hypothetical protein [Streptomyces sp. NBC_00203]|uniref:hypothetical protein n=1 Tax=Streptomyces sp. NBC_00203 TaxID=2975680 RepID=UPI003253A574
MTQVTAPTQQRPPGVKRAIRAYKVTREGLVTAQHATVSVPYESVPEPEPMNTQPAPCACAVRSGLGETR